MDIYRIMWRRTEVQSKVNYNILIKRKGTPVTGPTITSHNKVTSFTVRTLDPQAGEPPLVRCPRLLIQYIRRHPPYLDAVFSSDGVAWIGFIWLRTGTISGLL
jgi:hypothetical protein